MTKITIAIDAMGGDHGVKSTIPAALAALKKYPELHLVLVGKEEHLKRILKKRKALNHPRLSLQHASEEVEMDESPALALRNKKDSSMRVAVNLVKAGTAQACVSAGNTGALMATSRFVLKMLAGIDRPAIVYAMPGIDPETGERSRVHMLDLGANVDSSPEHLFQFAVMGSVLSSSISRIKNPRVALLNIGEEDMKGLESIKKAATLLSECEGIHYTGFVEGDDIFRNKADVIVCDGFIGNIALKTAEGMTQFVSQIVKSAIKANLLTRVAAFFALPVFYKIKKKLNVKSYNGATFIGLRGIVVKSHGGMDSEGFLSAIEVAMHEVEQDVPSKLAYNIEKLIGLRENVGED